LSLTPSLVPILNRKQQIHRRITMIANYKPSTRLIALGSIVLLAVLGCLTFTRATDKPALAPPAGVEKAAAEADQSQSKAKQRADVLARMLDEQESHVRSQQEHL